MEKVEKVLGFRKFSKQLLSYLFFVSDHKSLKPPSQSIHQETKVSYKVSQTEGVICQLQKGTLKLHMAAFHMGGSER